MKIIAGLGNPGAKYLLTRHNIGFMVVDIAATNLNGGPWQTEQNSLICKVIVNTAPAILIKPQTYMNNSGEAIASTLHYFKSDPSELLVIHDEIDLPFGALRFQTGRGHGGHNGIRSIHSQLGTGSYNRLKLGIGRPHHPQQEVADYVLENFNSSEKKELPDFLAYSAEAVECYLEHGLNLAATRYNRQGSA